MYFRLYEGQNDYMPNSIQELEKTNWSLFSLLVYYFNFFLLQSELALAYAF